MVYNILKNGETVKDLTGYVVRMEDAHPLYQLLHNINRKKSQGKKSEVRV